MDITKTPLIIDDPYNVVLGVPVDRERTERVPEPVELPATDKVLQEGTLVQDHCRSSECKPYQPAAVNSVVGQTNY